MPSLPLASGQALLRVAAQYGANVAFPYADEGVAFSIFDIGLAGVGLNFNATEVASASLLGTEGGAEANGTGFFALGFSGGAQALLSAGVEKYGSYAFYDPGVGIGGSLTIPLSAQSYRGTGAISDMVNTTSSGGSISMSRGAGMTSLALS